MENVRPTATLERFPMLPGPGKITVCEVANLLRTISSEEGEPVDFALYLNFPETYHHIMGRNLKPVVPLKIPSIRVTESADNFIIPAHEGWLKGMWSAFLDGGLSDCFNYLNREETVPPALRQTVAGLVSIWGVFQKLKRKASISLHPHYALEVSELIERYSPVRGWRDSWIRSISWHPTFSKLAIAIQDDSIRLFTNGVEDGFPYIKSPDQKKVTAIAWKPNTDRELAVGVAAGILIWTLDSSPKPAANRAKLLTISGHSPVTSVQYSPNGRHLLSSSSVDNSIYIWCACTYVPFALHRLGGGGVPLARWSPSGNQVFSNTPSAYFKVWSANREWAPTRWKTSGLPVEAMCWAPDGGMIFFASDSFLYTILVLPHEEDFVDTENTRSAIPVFDLRTILCSQEGSQKMFPVGGKVLQLSVSPCGTRLAILFDNSDVVALFRVQKRSPDFLYPLGFIRGFDREFPVAIDFQKNLVSEALLTIAWSTTRLQHFPMIDNASLMTNRMYEEEKINYFRRNVYNRSRDSDTSRENSFRNISGGGGAGDFDSNLLGQSEPDITVPRFKIFSSP